MSTTISALSAAAALGGTEPIPCVQTSATVKTTPQAIATFTLNTALAALSDIGTLLTTDQFYGVRSGAAYSVLAADVTTFIQAQVWIAGNTPGRSSFAAWAATPWPPRARRFFSTPTAPPRCWPAWNRRSCMACGCRQPLSTW